VTKLFISYSHKDEVLRALLETHLSMLKNLKVIDIWYDRKIMAGDEFARSIDSNLLDSQIIVLLVSPDFLASDYCWGVEMKEAMIQHEKGLARVIPVILRPCDNWHAAPFGKLLAVPKDGKPVTLWSNTDEAFSDVARNIRIAVQSLTPQVPPNPLNPPLPPRPSRKQVFCARCGATPGIQSTCTGAYTYHEFVEFGEYGAYCGRCGATAGAQSTCTGANTYHQFISSGAKPTYCIRCGALSGAKHLYWRAHVP
jgi:hypothetical protein